MDTDHQEIEWQYEAPGGLERVEEWLTGRGPGEFGLGVIRGPFEELIDTYYDTKDWRLYRACYALRVRREASGEGSEATMKSLVPATDNLHRRREISEPLEGDKVEALRKAPGVVGINFRTLVGSREVCPIFEVRTRRQTFELMLDDQASEPEKAQIDGSDVVRVGEVALDISEIPLRDGSARFTRVEVEADSPATADAPRLKGFVKAMENGLGLRPTTISKYEAGLLATGQNPDGKPCSEAKTKGRGGREE